MSGLSASSGKPAEISYPRYPSSSQPPAQDTVIVTHPHEGQDIVLGFLIGSILVLILALLYLAGPPLATFLRRKIPVSKKRIDRRYETIERWLITKRVRTHDDKCRRVSEEGSHCLPSEVNHKLISSTEIIPLSLGDRVRTFDTEDGNWVEPAGQTEDLELATVSPLECSICLEEFKAGDLVSYSTNPSCNHVHHHECLKEWLLRQAGCPLCRKAVLAVDCHGTSRLSECDLDKFLEQWRHRMLSTYFCLEEGLVVLEMPASVNDLSELSIRRKEIILPCIKRDELRDRRGGR